MNSEKSENKEKIMNSNVQKATIHVDMYIGIAGQCLDEHIHLIAVTTKEHAEKIKGMMRNEDYHYMIRSIQSIDNVELKDK